MDTDGVERLLGEIRDLNREHLDLYKEALDNQRKSIQSQTEAIAHQKRMMRMATVIVFPMLALVVGVLIWLLFFAV